MTTSMLFQDEELSSRLKYRDAVYVDVREQLNQVTAKLRKERFMNMSKERKK